MFDELYRLALESGADSERAGNYQDRATKAYRAFQAIISNYLPRRQKLANSTPDINLSLIADDAILKETVDYYFSCLIQQKILHNCDVNKRMETAQCAGLWHAAVLDRPPFNVNYSNSLTEEETIFLYETLVGLGFYVGIKVACLHGALEESRQKFTDLLQVTPPIRQYMIDHVFTLDLTGITGIYFTLYCSRCLAS